MSSAAKVKTILKAAKDLSAEERIQVALRLFDAAEPPDPHAHLDDEAWIAEMEKRADEALSGASRTYTWKQVKAHLLRKRKPRR